MKCQDYAESDSPRLCRLVERKYVHWMNPISERSLAIIAEQKYTRWANPKS